MARFVLENLSFTYPNAPRRALSDVSLTVEDGDFVLLCGASGCGKTTLLRLLSGTLAPVGEREGTLTINTENGPVGMVMQDPDDQIVCDTVRGELAFGAENLAVEPETIERRLGEICGFFGIGDLYRRKIETLSGGEKQTVALASLLVMGTKTILLDEPTAQLDPIAAQSFFSLLSRVNRELGVTVVLSEQRLDEAFPLATRVLCLDRGHVVACEPPRTFVATVRKSGREDLLRPLPAPVRVYAKTGAIGECPISVKEGQTYLESFKNIEKTLPHTGYRAKSDREDVVLRDAYFRYEKNGDDVLCGASLTVRQGEFFCLLGANGAGKSTLLGVLGGRLPLLHGSLSLLGEKATKRFPRGVTATMPQDARSLLSGNSLAEFLSSVARSVGASDERVNEVVSRLSLGDLMETHPYDLSGGERQRAVLAALLLTDAPILLLDEPTKGLDACAKDDLASLLRSLCEDGKTVVCVTHDTEFAAEYADRAALFFDGRVIAPADARTFFSQNRFYTTAAHRMSANRCDNAVTVSDVVFLCGKGADL